jgi:3-isopropylmalate/(R)-2-methylmalate dehydratase small subunit
VNEYARGQVSGRFIPLRGNDIDTDRIIPARYLKSVTFAGLGEHVFEDDRKQTRHHPFDDARFRGASILVVGLNFGCGSSREHAPQAIYRWGIRAIVGESFSDIFFGNSVAIGLPCVAATRADLDTLMAHVERHPRTIVRIDLARLTLESDAMTCHVRLPPPTQQAFVSGTWDTTGMLLDRFDEVRAVADRLPYVTGFSAARRP